MRGRGSSPQTRNHYKSLRRGMYNTALLPAYRTASGITLNPFRDVPRDTVVERTVTISLESLDARPGAFSLDYLIERAVRRCRAW